MRTAVTLCTLAALTIGGVVGCETNTPNSPAAQMDVSNRSQTALQQMTSQDGRLQDMINNSYGYAIFPEVGQGAIGVGGASGVGTVYQNGKDVGTVKLTQVSVGPQVGGDTYSELIVFQNQHALNRLMNNSLEFGAEANGTIVKAGAAAAARFDNGVGVFILPKGGLMAGANINGQKFHFMSDNGQAMDNSTSSQQTTTETKTTNNTPPANQATH